MIGAQNPAVAAQLAQRLGMQELAHAAQGGLPTIPAYVAAAELMRRRDLQSRAQGMQAMQQSAGDRSVLQDLLDGQPINPQGIGSLPALSMPKQEEEPQPQQQGGLPQPPAQSAPITTPERQGYAAGGLVAFDNGGEVESYPWWLAQTVFNAPGHSLLDIPRSLYKTNYEPDVTPSGIATVAPQPTAAYPNDSGEEEFGPAIAPPPIAAPTTTALGGGIRSFSPMTPPTVSPVIPEWLKVPSEPGSVEQFMKERRALMPQGQALEGLAAASDALKQQIASRRSDNAGEALLQAGSAMMASRSPYFMQALGEAGQAGLASFRSGRKDIDALQQLQTQYVSTVDQARRAEAIGDVNAAQQARERAQTIAEKYNEMRTVYAAHDVASQRAMYGHYATANAEMARVNAMQTQAHDDRVAALEEHAYQIGYQSAKDALANDPKAMMLDERQKEQIARRRGEQNVEDFRRRRNLPGGGISSLPDTGSRMRGRIDSSGSLVQ